MRILDSAIFFSSDCFGPWANSVVAGGSVLSPEKSVSERNASPQVATRQQPPDDILYF